MMLEKYIALFIYFQQSIYEEITTSIEEISGILFCTQRNSKAVLKKLVNLKWINWNSGVGRGNKSKINFLIEPYNLIMERCRELVKHGEIKAARSLIDSYRELYPSLISEFNSWIDTLFGYKVEIKENKRFDVLRLKLEMSPIVEHLDPTKAALRSDRHILRQIGDTLLRYNEALNKFEPNIAFYWEYDKSKRNLYMYLNKGVKFHNGKPLTSEDVAYTFNRFKASENNAYKWMLEDLERINIIDDYILEFNLKNTNGLFLQILSDEYLSILPFQLDSVAEGMMDKLFIGTGPFKIMKNDDDMLVLEANDDYFKGRAFLDRIELWSMKGGMITPNNVNEGKYDLCPKQITYLNEGDAVKQIECLDKSIQYLSINLNKKGPFQKAAFRRAFKNIINTSLMINELGGERCEAAKGFIFSSDKICEQLDSYGIKQLLAESCYNGEMLNLYTYDHGLDHVEDANWIQAECKKFGVVINIQFMALEELEKLETIKEADLIHDSATLNESLEMSYLHILLSDNSFIKHHFDDNTKNDLDSEIRRVNESGDRKERIELLKNIEGKILDRNNVIPLYRSQINLQTHNIIQDVRINTLGWIDFYHIWFKKPH